VDGDLKKIYQCKIEDSVSLSLDGFRGSSRTQDLEGEASGSPRAQLMHGLGLSLAAEGEHGDLKFRAGTQLLTQSERLGEFNEARIEFESNRDPKTGFFGSAGLSHTEFSNEGRAWGAKAQDRLLSERRESGDSSGFDESAFRLHLSAGHEATSMGGVCVRQAKLYASLDSDGLDQSIVGGDYMVRLAADQPAANTFQAYLEGGVKSRVSGNGSGSVAVMGAVGVDLFNARTRSGSCCFRFLAGGRLDMYLNEEHGRGEMDRFLYGGSGQPEGFICINCEINF
jgi:hypothetical protein